MARQRGHTMGHRTSAPAMFAAALTMAGCAVQQHPYIVPASTHTSLGIIHGDEGAKPASSMGPLPNQATPGGHPSGRNRSAARV